MTTVYGKLFLVATPLGNLEDITYRALRILSEVQLIAAEDTRHTLKLLNYFKIKKRLVSFHQHNEWEKAPGLITELHNGLDIALVSDAGMPGISDPGSYLVAQAIAAGITVIPIPGPSAVVTALAASGLDTSAFIFLGFLPRKKAEQIIKIEQVINFNGTLIFYESPHRLKITLKNLISVLGDRQAVIARELTKIHEEFIRGNLIALLERVSTQNILGEFTILISGLNETEKNLQNSTNSSLTAPASSILDYFVEMSNNGNSLKDELKNIAKKTGKSSKEIYRLYLEYRQNN